MQSTTRRNWLRSAFTLTAGLPLGLSLADRLMAAPMSKAEEFFLNNPRPGSIKIRLNSNENPYGPSEKAKQAVLQILSEGSRYPFENIGEMKQLLAEKEGVTPDHITIGPGSSELLCVAGLAFGIEGGRILSAFPTFPTLMRYAQEFGATWDKVDLNEKLEHRYDAMASQIKSDTKLIFVCNPNNPTGTWVDPDVVKDFCEEASKKVIVYSDEAYLEFMEPSQQKSMVELVKENKNVIVSRTFSKIYGIAGLRIGYVVAKPDLIRKMSNYQMGIPMSQPAFAAAKASLYDKDFMNLTRTKNGEARKHLTDYLDRKGYFYGKSFTNFVFFDAKINGREVMTKLSEAGIGIRVWDYQGKEWCRVSIGTLEEMKLFTKEFEKITA